VTSAIARTPNEQQAHVDLAVVDRVRDICLGLPGTSEKPAWGDPSFRANGRMYAILKFGKGTALWCTAPDGAQEALIQSNPARFYKPSNHPLHNGWIGLRLEPSASIDWDEVAFLLAQAHEVVCARTTSGRRKD
jgi:predicted DNA-binding protein (MmcQ/YjbR family)